MIQVLGDGGKKWICDEKFFIKMPEVLQHRPKTAGSELSFEDVGIDEAGQPNIERKQLAHRQFGAQSTIGSLCLVAIAVYFHDTCSTIRGCFTALFTTVILLQTSSASLSSAVSTCH